MGVRGLSRFVDENNFYRTFELRDTKVVIDGCSLLHCLYACSGANYMYGGDYDVYADSIKKYFSCLKECNIESIVIFDGGYDKSNRLMKKLLERQKHKLENIEKLIMSNGNTSEILPINSYEVFKSILSEMGILYAQCDYEGDNQMASLAACYGCPILSDDSDFYIYDLPNGFIRLNDIKTEILNDGFRRKYLSCKIYLHQTILSTFNLRDRNVLPLLATLAGNDYASPYEEIKQFYYKTGIPVRGKFKGLFNWLQNKTIDEAKNEVLKLIEKEKKAEVKSIIENSVDDYKIKSTNMVNILSSIRSNEEGALIHESNLITFCGAALPREFVVAFHKGQLPTILLNIITLHRYILLPQIDDFTKISSYTCSRYIRQVIYGILLQHESINSWQHAQDCLRRIEEFDRNGRTVQETLVEFLFKLRNGDPVLKLNDIHKNNKDQLRDFMASVMEVKKDFISDIPSNLQLFFICMNYWCLKSSPKPPVESLPALILCVIYFQAREIVTSNAVHLGTFITLPAANLIFRNFEKYFQKPMQSFDASIVHSFSQFQACISDCVALNSLIQVPFEPPKLHKLFNGTLLYNLTKELQSKSKPFIKSLLGDEASEIFSRLLKKFVDSNTSYLTYINYNT